MYLAYHLPYNQGSSSSSSGETGSNEETFPINDPENDGDDNPDILPDIHDGIDGEEANESEVEEHDPVIDLAPEPEDPTEKSEFLIPTLVHSSL